MPLLFSQTVSWLSDLKAGEVCQKQAEAVPEKPATSRLFNVWNSRSAHAAKSDWVTRNLILKSLKGSPKTDLKARSQKTHSQKEFSYNPRLVFQIHLRMR